MRRLAEHYPNTFPLLVLTLFAVLLAIGPLVSIDPPQAAVIAFAAIIVSDGPGPLRRSTWIAAPLCPPPCG